jgi:hypothetical protein
MSTEVISTDKLLKLTGIAAVTVGINYLLNKILFPE